jgi:hypothetical protein
MKVNMKKGPNLTKWCMLGIKEGTKLYRKGKDKHEAITKSFISMETQILDGKEKKTLGGIALCEKYFREKDGKQLTKTAKKPNPEQGWEYWGILDADNKWKSLYSIYKSLDHDVMRKRRDTEEVEETTN